MKTERLIQLLSDEGPKKPMLHPMIQTLLWLFAMFLYILLFAGYTGLRPDFAEKFFNANYFIELLLLIGIGVSSAWTAFCLARPDGHQIPGLKLISFMFVLLWIVIAFSGTLNQINSQEIIQSMSLKQFDCPAHIALFSLPPGIALFLFIRTGVTTQFYWAGAMATLSVTSMGYLLMRIIEPNDNPAHLIIWHALPIIAISLLGIMMGKLVLKWR